MTPEIEFTFELADEYTVDFDVVKELCVVMD